MNPEKGKIRFPDAIGIGIAKSGTGSLAFLDCHSKIRFRAYEPGVFPIRRDGRYLPRNESFQLDAEGVYSNQNGYWIPYATDDEFLIEEDI